MYQPERSAEVAVRVPAGADLHLGREGSGRGARALVEPQIARGVPRDQVGLAVAGGVTDGREGVVRVPAGADLRTGRPGGGRGARALVQPQVARGVPRDDVRASVAGQVAL